MQDNCKGCAEKNPKNLALQFPNTTLLRIEIADIKRLLIYTANTIIMVNYSLFYFNLNIYIICFEELCSLTCNINNLRRRKYTLCFPIFIEKKNFTSENIVKILKRRATTNQFR